MTRSLHLFTPENIIFRYIFFFTCMLLYEDAALSSTSNENCSAHSETSVLRKEGGVLARAQQQADKIPY